MRASTVIYYGCLLFYLLLDCIDFRHRKTLFQLKFTLLLIKVSRRPVSRDSLLESESQFLAVDDPKQMLPIEQMSSRPRQSSARERRRWKQLEDMARNPRVRRLLKVLLTTVSKTVVFSLGLITSYWLGK